ncbi:MAG TPA: tRNA-specific adenosine deaminase, partial [Ruminococcaceae bacterium]|nr:tRNA-specific adenosine deaminase [Oscillospiraceae bacterium]
MTTDEKWMLSALQQAEMAAADGEVPVGAVIVRNGVLIAAAHNQRESHKNALCHAELSAIEQACTVCGGWRLEDCEMYVTLEPCPMCAGAVINARLKRVIYGSADKKA